MVYSLNYTSFLIVGRVVKTFVRFRGFAVHSLLYGCVRSIILFFRVCARYNLSKLTLGFSWHSFGDGITLSLVCLYPVHEAPPSGIINI